MAFIDEIYEQPASLKRFIDRYFTGEPDEVIAFKKLISQKDIKKYFFTGMGSSLFASYIPCKYLRQHGIEAYAFETNEFMNYCSTLIDDNTLVIAVSQSGECKEILRLIEAIKSKHNYIAVTNYMQNSLARKSKIIFDICAGTEKYSASKTYTNSIAVLFYIACLIAGKDMSEITNEYLKVLKAMESIMAEYRQNIDEIYGFFKEAGYIAVVGSGSSYSTACHSELILQEAGKIFSAGYTAGQFTHGPNEMISNGYNAIILDFDEKMRNYADRIIRDVLDYGGKILVITNRNPDIVNDHIYILKIDYYNAFLSPIIEIIPIELFVNRIGLEKKLHPGVLTHVVK